MSTRKKKDVRAAAQVTEEIDEKSEEKKAPETADVPAAAGSNLWVVLMLIVPLGLCLLWGALTR